MSSLSFLNAKFDLSSPEFVAVHDEQPLWSAMFGLLLLDEVPLAGMRKVLDVGCGTGFPLIELAERLGPGSQAHGLDLWGAALARGRAKASSRGLTHVEFHEASADSMPFADASFDLIVSSLGVNNFDDRQAAFRECRRVARDGATIALTTNVQGHMRELYAVFEELLADDESSLERLRAHVAHRATEVEVRQLLEDSGFRVTRVVERQSAMRFANGEALFNHHLIKLGFLEGWKSIVPGEEREFFTRAIERLRDEVHLTIPMLYVEARVPPHAQLSVVGGRFGDKSW